MQVIIVGCGKVGRNLAEQLQAEDIECATVLNFWLEVKYKDFLVKKDFILSIAIFLGALILTK